MWSPQTQHFGLSAAEDPNESGTATPSSGYSAAAVAAPWEAEPSDWAGRTGKWFLVAVLNTESKGQGQSSLRLWRLPRQWKWQAGIRDVHHCYQKYMQIKYLCT